MPRAGGLCRWAARDVCCGVSGAVPAGRQVGVCRAAPSAGGCLAWGVGGGAGRPLWLSRSVPGRTGGLTLPCLVIHPPTPLSLFFFSSGESPPTTSAPKPAPGLSQARQEGCCPLPLTVSGPGAGEAPPAFPHCLDSPRNVVDSGAELCWALALGVAAGGGKGGTLGPCGARAACRLEDVGGKVSGAPHPHVSPPEPQGPSHQEKLLFLPSPPWHDAVSCHCSLRASHSCRSPVCPS